MKVIITTQIENIWSFKQKTTVLQIEIVVINDGLSDLKVS